MVAGKQQPFVKGRCSGLFCNGGNPVVQPQGVFLFSFYLKVSTGQWMKTAVLTSLLCLALWSTLLRLKMQVQ